MIVAEMPVSFAFVDVASLVKQDKATSLVHLDSTKLID